MRPGMHSYRNRKRQTIKSSLLASAAAAAAAGHEDNDGDDVDAQIYTNPPPL